jgi:hypothetical protein
LAWGALSAFPRILAIVTDKRIHPPCKTAVQSEIDPALRRAFMWVNPDYFVWPVEEQERYRVSMPEGDAFRIRQALLKELFGIHVKSAEEMEAAVDAFTDKEHVALNKALLPVVGIGEDSFFLNEFLSEDRTLLDFRTLYDYDYDDHSFQEQARREEVPQYVVKPYRGSLYQAWARLLIDGEFHYASLSMAAGDVYSAIEEFGYEKLAALMPHRYVHGKDHGKREGKGTIFSQKISADGMELQVEELQRRLWAYLSERYEALLTEFDGQARKVVYLEDRSRENDPHMNFVFSDKTALQAVRFRHFMSDCRTLIADRSELDTLADRERQALGEHMESACGDILANFNPKIVPLRKKRKIIVADSARKDLF